MHTIFACGADIKSRFSFFNGGQFHFSDDFDNLEVPANYTRYIKAIKYLLDTNNLSPDCVTYDLHPGYFSSQAREMFSGEIKKIGVQHHHAHIASVLAQLNSKDTVIGVCFDGTGYGWDGNLWGGEFLLVSPQNCLRKAHFSYIKMPGGEKAIREPWRMAFALAYDCLGEELFEYDFAFMKQRQKRDYLFLKTMLDQTINVPLTSSCGRLFDAVSSLLDITHVAHFEAEAAINLEKLASLSEDTCVYDFIIEKDSDVYSIGFSSLLEGIIRDLENSVPREDIAKRFHNTLGTLILSCVKSLREETGIEKVVLSGGVFQNKLLYALTRKLLKEEGLCLLEERNVPLTDLGICMGQTYVALHHP